MEVSGIYARTSPTLDRVVQVGVVSGKLISVSFPDAIPDDAEHDNAYLDAVIDAIAGEDADLGAIQIGLTVPTDQRAVLEAVRNVPRGDAVDIGVVVRMAGLDPEDDDSKRLVRETLAANPIPVVIPDHRVRDTPSGAPADVADALRRAEGI
ncbi:MGMT family protein [Haloferax sp. DFSO52]|uniref:MGMT family protein n=1 Tax=Haloferax sp. DFSO52 TaxID=3388505 RepID=UPI003A859E9F